MKKSLSVSVVISAHNESKNIKEAVESARNLTDRIFVIDIESEDTTASLAKKAGAEVVSFPFTPYVEPSREFSIKKSTSDWVFILDADERITKELAGEIKRAINNTDLTHFKIPRKNIFGRKKWLRHGGWWPDHQIRLIKKDSFVSWPKIIHSTPQIKGTQGVLINPLVHYFHGDFENMVNKTTVFEDIESRLLLKADKQVSTGTFFRKFFGELFRRLIKTAGFLDGTIGIIEAVYQAFSKTITYLFLYEKKGRSSI